MTAPYSSRFRIFTFYLLLAPDDIFNKATLAQLISPAAVYPKWGRKQDGIEPDKIESSGAMALFTL